MKQHQRRDTLSHSAPKRAIGCCDAARDCLEIEFLAVRPNRKITQTEKNLGAEFLASRRESLPFLRPQMGKRRRAD